MDLPDSGTGTGADVVQPNTAASAENQGPTPPASTNDHGQGQRTWTGDAGRQLQVSNHGTSAGFLGPRGPPVPDYNFDGATSGFEFPPIDLQPNNAVPPHAAANPAENYFVYDPSTGCYFFPPDLPTEPQPTSHAILSMPTLAPQDAADAGQSSPLGKPCNDIERSEFNGILTSTGMANHHGHGPPPKNECPSPENPCPHGSNSGAVATPPIPGQSNSSTPPLVRQDAAVMPRALTLYDRRSDTNAAVSPSPPASTIDHYQGQLTLFVSQYEDWKSYANAQAWANKVIPKPLTEGQKLEVLSAKSQLEIARKPIRDSNCILSDLQNAFAASPSKRFMDHTTKSTLIEIRRLQDQGKFREANQVHKEALGRGLKLLSFEYISSNLRVLPYEQQNHIFTLTTDGEGKNLKITLADLKSDASQRYYLDREKISALVQQVSRLIPNQLTHFHPNEVLGANQQLVAYGGLQAGSASALIENARLRAEIEAEKKMGNEKAARTAAEATATTLREERANRAFQEHERELVRREQQRKDEEQRAAQKRAEIEVQFKHQQELERVRMQHELVLNRERQAHALQQQQQFLQAVKQGNADVVQQLKDHVTETARKQPVEGAVREDIHGYTNNLADRFANAHNGMPSRSSYESPPAKRKPYKSPAGTTYKELLGKKLEDFTDSDEDSVATAPPKQSKPVQHQWSSNAANVENKIPKYKKVEAPLFIDTSFSIDAAEEGGILDATPADRARKACFRSPHPRKPLEEKVAPLKSSLQSRPKQRGNAAGGKPSNHNLATKPAVKFVVDQQNATNAAVKPCPEIFTFSIPGRESPPLKFKAPTEKTTALLDTSISNEETTTASKVETGTLEADATTNEAEGTMAKSTASEVATISEAKASVTAVEATSATIQATATEVEATTPASTTAAAGNSAGVGNEHVSELGDFAYNVYEVEIDNKTMQVVHIGSKWLELENKKVCSKCTSNKKFTKNGGYCCAKHHQVAQVATGMLNGAL